MQQLPKQEIAYLAALFHDIAKGRGGDHSQLGAVDAEAFCLEQGLSLYDARLVAWLVLNHLELSVSAQKRDIGDPKVINEFARHVGDEVRLDYLYVLTCADVRGTNPKLWNSWKASLFQEFYEHIRAALRRGLESPIDQDQLLAREPGLGPRAAGGAGHQRRMRSTRAWAALSPAYFLRHSPEEIAWFTRLYVQRDPGDDEPLVAVEPRSQRGTTAVLIFAPHRHHGFARATAVLDQLGLTIVDARITPAANGFSLDLYHVLEDDGAPIDGHRSHRRDGGLAVAFAATARGLQSRGVAPRAAPGPHVQHADAGDHLDAMSATTARCWNWWPATGRACSAMSARCCGKSASICRARGSARLASAPKTCSTLPTSRSSR